MLGRSDIEPHESELKTNGSIPAALALAVDGLENLSGDLVALRFRRDFVLEHEIEGSREVMGVLRLISGHLSDYKFCDHFLESVENAGDPYFGYELYRILEFKGAEPSISKKYLRSSACRGCLSAQKESVRLKMLPLGPVGLIGNAFYAMHLSALSTLIFLRDSRDKWLPRV